MATGPGFPSATNVFIPDWESSGKVTVGFSRNPKSFAYNRYISYAFSRKNRGYWMRWNNQAQARVLNTNAYLWAYNQDRPVPANPESFTWIEFVLTRRDYAYGHDLDTIDQADFNLMQVDRDGHAQLAATSRAYRIATALSTTSNFATTADPDMTVNHYSTATALTGGTLNAGTATDPNLKDAITEVCDIINTDTNGKLGSQPGKMVMVLNPTDARLIGQSAELVDFMKGSPYSYPSFSGNLFDNSLYGLPPSIYGVEVVVDGTTRVTSEVGASTVTRAYTWPSGTVGIFFKPDALDGVYGEKPFSTMTVFYRAAGENSQSIDSTGIDLTVTEFQDTRNRRWEGHVTEETAEVVTAPATGYLITSATA